MFHFFVRGKVAVTGAWMHIYITCEDLAVLKYEARYIIQ